MNHLMRGESMFRSLYKADVLELLSWCYRKVPVPADGPPTRDIVFAEFQCESGRLVCIAIIGLLEEAALKNLNRGGSSLQRSVELLWILFFTAHHQKISLLWVTLMTTQRISL